MIGYTKKINIAELLFVCFVYFVGRKVTIKLVVFRVDFYMQIAFSLVFHYNIHRSS